MGTENPENLINILIVSNSESVLYSLSAHIQFRCFFSRQNTTRYIDFYIIIFNQMFKKHVVEGDNVVFFASNGQVLIDQGHQIRKILFAASLHKLLTV